MKLLLMWLLGVHVLVTAMVMARSLADEGQQRAQGTVTGVCSRDLNPHHVAPSVTQQGHGISCDRLSIN